MRFQSFAIIFVAIILPISMVLSYYIEARSETINRETEYQSRLNNATYAAVSAYQMNSLNTGRVAGESNYAYVDASINTFFTTLATSMQQSNASKSTFRNYIPAILFTTYDGYYIYSPYKAAVAAVNIEDGQNILTKQNEVIYIKASSTLSTYRVSKATAEYLKGQKTIASTDPNFTVDIDKAKMDYSYKLKPFIYYSARYKGSNYDFVASYSLDNFMSISGKVGTDAFSKAGYGIDPGDVKITGDFLVKTAARTPGKGTSEGCVIDYLENGSIDESTFVLYHKRLADGDESQKGVKFQRIPFADIEEFIFDYKHAGERNAAAGNSDGNVYYYSNIANEDVAKSGVSLVGRFQTGDQIIEHSIFIQNEYAKKGWNENDRKLITLGGDAFSDLTVTYKEQLITDPDAKVYYIKAYFFSKWVQTNLGPIVTEGNVVENAQIGIDKENDEGGVYDYFTGSGRRIFDFGLGNDPSSDLSAFYNHKTSIIKNSIQSNLNAAISNFNEDRRVGTDYVYTYKMPVMTASDWDNILNNVCMVAFLQGLPSGSNRRFNNYAIVKSSNNNTYVTPDSLYFTTEIGTGETPSDAEFHKLDCPKLGSLANGQIDGVGDGKNELTADRSAEFKYDAKRMNCLVLVNGSSGDVGTEVIAFEDEEATEFYAVKRFTDMTSEVTVGPKIDDPKNYTVTTTDGVTHTVNLFDPNQVVTSRELKYLYDHKNLGCYDCIISGNFDSVVKFYDNDLYLTGMVMSTGEIVIDYKKNLTDTDNWLKLNGTPYTGSETPKIVLTQIYGCTIGQDELTQRRQALYNALGKFKETQYKNNGYMNL